MKKNKVGTKNQETRDDWIKEQLSIIPKNSRLLDAGAGELRYKKHCSHLLYTSQDFCEYNGEGDKKGLQTSTFDTSAIDIVSDITEIPVESSSFDYILCTEVIEHIPNPHLALKEFQRILKKGGKLILTAPFCSLTHYAPFHYCTGFNKYFYNYTLETKLGFKILETHINGNYYEYLGQELRRLPSISKRYSKKTIGFFSKLLIGLLLTDLKKLSDCDSGSEELLCHGYHIVAEKK